MTPRVAFITSAAKGLGHATVKSLLRAGWDVCLTYGNSVEEAHLLEVEARRLNRRLLTLRVDLLDKSAVTDAVLQCLAEFSRIDALIHNFGPFVFERVALAEYDDDMWQRMFDGNLHNFFWMYRLVIEGMRERAFGRFITIGYDGAGDAVGWRYRSAYAAAKAGLASLTRSVAREERQNGITANMVCPGDIRGANKMKMIDEVRESTSPLGRSPVGEDVARMIVWLCDEDSQQLNGTVTEVTGGYDILAYDDGTNVVQEPERFQVGDEVWVHPWNLAASVREVVKVPNRNLVYRVGNESMSGSFTQYQLKSCLIRKEGE
jgi:3-oxoacyl-[acyl-carrier protein] reductase